MFNLDINLDINYKTNILIVSSRSGKTTDWSGFGSGKFQIGLVSGRINSGFERVQIDPTCHHFIFSRLDNF